MARASSSRRKSGKARKPSRADPRSVPLVGGMVGEARDAILQRRRDAQSTDRFN